LTYSATKAAPKKVYPLWEDIPDDSTITLDDIYAEAAEDGAAEVRRLILLKALDYQTCLPTYQRCELNPPSWAM
jgi:hypothetical protein